MQDHRAKGGAAHPSIGDADHVSDALLQHLAGEPEVADLRHARVALRPAALKDEHAVFVDVQVGVVDPRVIVLDGLKHHGPATVGHQFRRCRVRFDDRPAGAQVATQHRNARVRKHRVCGGFDDVRVCRFCRVRVCVGGEGLAGHRWRVTVDHVGQVGEHRREPAGVEEVLHEVIARWLQVHEEGRVVAEAVKVIDRQFHPESPGDGQEMYHGIC